MGTFKKNLRIKLSLVRDSLRMLGGMCHVLFLHHALVSCLRT